MDDILALEEVRTKLLWSMFAPFSFLPQSMCTNDPRRGSPSISMLLPHVANSISVLRRILLSFQFRTRLLNTFGTFFVGTVASSVSHYRGTPIKSRKFLTSRLVILTSSVTATFVPTRPAQLRRSHNLPVFCDIREFHQPA